MSVVLNDLCLNVKIMGIVIVKKVNIKWKLFKLNVLLFFEGSNVNDDCVFNGNSSVFVFNIGVVSRINIRVVVV